MKTLSIAEALREAIAQEMRRDERVFCIGEDIAIPGGWGGAFTVTLGLEKEFKDKRICVSFLNLYADAVLEIIIQEELEKYGIYSSSISNDELIQSGITEEEIIEICTNKIHENYFTSVYYSGLLSEIG